MQFISTKPAADEEPLLLSQVHIDRASGVKVTVVFDEHGQRVGSIAITRISLPRGEEARSFLSLARAGDTPTHEPAVSEY